MKDNFVKVCLKFNVKKCKVLNVNIRSVVGLNVGNSEVKEVDSFMYLNVNVIKDGGGIVDIKRISNG